MLGGGGFAIWHYLHRMVGWSAQKREREPIDLIGLQAEPKIEIMPESQDSFFPYQFDSCPGQPMLAKKTSKNQITLPKTVIRQFPGVDYFDVQEQDGLIVLRPVRPNQSDEVRRKLAELGISEQDVADAVEWARKA